MTIPNELRELLEQLLGSDGIDGVFDAGKNYDAHQKLRALLAKAAAPRCTCPSGDGSLAWPCPAHPAPADGEAVEVVAWRIGFPNGGGFKVYEQRQPWAYESYGRISYQVYDLMTVAQHQRIVARMESEMAKCLREQDAELHATREELAQRDAKLAEYAELLRELRCLPDSYHMIGRIDAALAAAGVEE